MLIQGLKIGDYFRFKERNRLYVFLGFRTDYLYYSCLNSALVYKIHVSQKKEIHMLRKYSGKYLVVADENTIVYDKNFQAITLDRYGLIETPTHIEVEGTEFYIDESITVLYRGGTDEINVKISVNNLINHQLLDGQAKVIQLVQTNTSAANTYLEDITTNTDRIP